MISILPFSGVYLVALSTRIRSSSLSRFGSAKIRTLSSMVEMNSCSSSIKEVSRTTWAASTERLSSDFSTTCVLLSLRAKKRSFSTSCFILSVSWVIARIDSSKILGSSLPQRSKRFA